MWWTTVYIRGRKGFQDALLAKMNEPWLLGSSEADNHLVMFWLPNAARLRSLKMAIGSKLIFKYRLHFFTDLNAYLKLKNKQSTDLSIHENDMVIRMVEWENKHSNLFQV